MSSLRYRVEQRLVACCYAFLGLPVGVLILLRAANPRRVARSVAR